MRPRMDTNGCEWENFGRPFGTKGVLGTDHPPLKRWTIVEIPAGFGGRRARLWTELADPPRGLTNRERYRLKPGLQTPEPRWLKRWAIFIYPFGIRNT